MLYIHSFHLIARSVKGRCNPDRLHIFPVIVVFRFRYVGEACHDLGHFLPIVLAGDEEGVQILADKRQHIPLGAVPAEKRLGSPVIRVADNESVTLLPSVTQHQFDVTPHAGLAVKAVAEGVGHIGHADARFEFFEVYLVIRHTVLHCLDYILILALTACVLPIMAISGPKVLRAVMFRKAALSL